MSADDKNYANASATKHRPDAKWASRLNENEFLANQRADAQQAVTDALDDLKQSLTQAADPKLWAKEHPWASLGIAAVAGFAAAAAVIPRRDETVGEHFSHVASKLRRNGKQRTDDEQPVEKAGMMSSLFDKLFDLAKVAIGNLIMMQVQSRMAQYSDEQHPEEQNTAEQAAAEQAAAEQQAAAQQAQAHYGSAGPQAPPAAY